MKYTMFIEVTIIAEPPASLDDRKPQPIELEKKRPISYSGLSFDQLAKLYASIQSGEIV